MRSTLLPLLLLLLSACGPDQTPVLLYVYPPESTTSNKTEIEVNLGGHYGKYCGTVSSDATFVFDNTVLPVISRGGSSVSTDGFGGVRGNCGQPAARGTALPDRSGTDHVRVMDGATVLVDADILLLTPRKLVVVSPADGIIRNNSDVVVRWEPQTDVLEMPEPNDVVRPISFEQAPDGPFLGGAQITNLNIDGSTFRFHVEGLPPDPVNSILRAHARTVHPVGLPAEGSRFQNVQAELAFTNADVRVVVGGN